MADETKEDGKSDPPANNSGGTDHADTGQGTGQDTEKQEPRIITGTTVNESIRGLMGFMEDVDKKTASPEVRARKVWKRLDNEGLSVWDLACFCVETLGYLLPVYPHMEAQIKAVNIELYRTHYANWEDISKWEEPIKSPIIIV